ncbi:MAG: chemotaxis protein CheC [Oscillospiraceae bacterium]
MINNENRELTAMQVDALAELGNIGASTAATALSQMLSMSIDVKTPEVKMLNPNEAAIALGGYERIVVGMMFSFTGDFCGLMVFLIGEEFACNALYTLMMGMKEYPDLSEAGEMERSALCEIGNIMAASYLRALSQVIDSALDLSVPSISIDMLGAVLNAPAVAMAPISDKMLFIEGNFEMQGKATPCNILLMPDEDAMDQLMNKLGIEK